jgi:hypothetical protein
VVLKEPFLGWRSTDKQKRKHVKICCHEAQAVADAQFLNTVITWDESWIKQYEPEIKQQSLVWKHKDSPPPKKFACGKRHTARFREVGGAL